MRIPQTAGLLWAVAMTLLMLQKEGGAGMRDFGIWCACDTAKNLSFGRHVGKAINHKSFFKEQQVGIILSFCCSVGGHYTKIVHGGTAYQEDGKWQDRLQNF